MEGLRVRWSEACTITGSKAENAVSNEQESNRERWLEVAERAKKALLGSILGSKGGPEVLK